jgi:hypothetical protein
MSALFQKYSLGSGCRKVATGTCSFNHDVSSASKVDERAAASRVANATKKAELMTAIG